jgi:hypothetical protein
MERYLGLAPAFSLECERAPHDTNIALKWSGISDLHRPCGLEAHRAPHNTNSALNSNRKD